MATPAQLVAEAVSGGYVRLSFKQDDETMDTALGVGRAVILLQYPIQGELVRHEGDPSETERKAELLNDLLLHFNEQLRGWCS